MSEEVEPPIPILLTENMQHLLDQTVVALLLLLLVYTCQPVKLPSDLPQRLPALLHRRPRSPRRSNAPLRQRKHPLRHRRRRLVPRYLPVHRHFHLPAVVLLHRLPDMGRMESCVGLW